MVDISRGPCRSNYFFDLFLLLILSVVSLATIEEPRVIGQPSLSCSSKYAIFRFNTSDPFQGRVAVLDSHGVPDTGCTYEFSYNLNVNATVYIDLERCTQTYFASNHSRIYHAHIDISFHPLVITHADRVYHVQCIDNSFNTNSLESTDKDAKPIANCSMLTRPASRWESSSKYHIGDSVVHEWSCAFKRSDQNRYYSFLTNCNAVSRAGEIIHLVDENGCIVDAELMGEMAYSNYTARVSARARIFRFVSGSMFRIECQFRICSRAKTCAGRSTPPRCAFTKEDFQRHFDPNATRHGISNFSPGILGERNGTDSEDELDFTAPMSNSSTILLSEGGPFEHTIPVYSEWFTVANNHFTDLDALQDRYFLTSELNYSLPTKAVPAAEHFLAAIAYRPPSSSLDSSSAEKPTTERRHHELGRYSSSSRAPKQPSIITAPPDPSTTTEEQRKLQIGTKFEVDPSSSARSHSSPDIRSSSPGRLSAVITETPPHATRPASKTLTPWLPPRSSYSSKKSTSVESTTTSASHIQKSKHITSLSGAKSTTEDDFLLKSVDDESVTLLNFNTEDAGSGDSDGSKLLESRRSTSTPGGRLSTLRNSLERTAATVAEIRGGGVGVSTNTEPPSETSTESDDSSSRRPVKVHTDPPFTDGSSYTVDSHKHSDWRLHDLSFNDTDAAPVNCSSQTQIMPIDGGRPACRWTSLEHFLLIWGLVSFVGWVLLIGFAIYRYNSRRPEWVEFRHPDGSSIGGVPSNMNMQCVLPQEHPWLHPDAFEHRRHAYKGSVHSREIIFGN